MNIFESLIITFHCFLTSHSSLLEVQPLKNIAKLESFQSPDLEAIFIDSTTSLGSSKHVHFYLYTKRATSDSSEEFSVANSKFLPSSYKITTTGPLKVLIHGFNSRHEYMFPYELKDSYLKKHSNINVILVDWKVLGEPPIYPQAVLNTALVSHETTELLKFLILKNMTTLDKINLVGHSLGAHISGMIGHKLRKRFGRVGRITGLDAAKPLYELADLDRRLDKSDAIFVDVIHTSTLGLYNPLGHVDFYPNQGIQQTWCLAADLITGFTCSHCRASHYFKESVSKPKKFKACKCTAEFLGYPLVTPKQCQCDDSDGDSVAYMGGVSHEDRGAFYLTTDSRSLSDNKC